MAVSLLLISFAVLVAGESSARASGWEGTRELSMRLKESGRFLEAYNNAKDFTSSRSSEMYDKEFVSGWIALRNLHRADISLSHFKNMASYIDGLRSEQQGVAKAKTGYWLGRALRELGREKDAEVFFRTSLAFPTTFYGQLSASALKVPITKKMVRNLKASDYPIVKFYWHDPRVKSEFVHAVIRIESRFQQHATSGKKARGMMQVLDGTALHVGKQAGVNVDIEMMRTNADYNIAVGSRYLGDLFEQYGNPMLALAAYNAGPLRADEWLERFGDPRGGRTDVVDWVENIPFRETREYVQKVMSSYITYNALLSKD